MNKKADKILKSTIKLFLKNGIKKTTMDEIAEKANVSKVTIYKYFGDKESLYAEVSNEIFTNYISLLENIVCSDSKLYEKLFVYMDILTDFTISGKRTLCDELSMYNDNIQEQYSLYKKRYKETLYKLINEGKGINIIRDDVDTEKIYFYIDMGIDYFHNNLEYRNKVLSDNCFQNDFMEFFVNNIFIDTKELIK